MVLALLFPSYAISLNKDSIALKKEGTEEVYFLNSENFDIFQRIIKQMFSFGPDDQESDFNPDGALASKIAEKLRKRHQKLAEKDANSKVDVYSRFASVLAIAMNLSIKDVMEFTPYQLFDQLNRYELKGHVYARSNTIHSFLSQQLSQFWYSPETALCLAEIAVS